MLDSLQGLSISKTSSKDTARFQSSFLELIRATTLKEKPQLSSPIRRVGSWPSSDAVDFSETEVPLISEIQLESPPSFTRAWCRHGLDRIYLRFLTKVTTINTTQKISGTAFISRKKMYSPRGKRSPHRSSGGKYT